MGSERDTGGARTFERGRVAQLTWTAGLDVG